MIGWRQHPAQISSNSVYGSLPWCVRRKEKAPNAGLPRTSHGCRTKRRVCCPGGWLRVCRTRASRPDLEGLLETWPAISSSPAAQHSMSSNMANAGVLTCAGNDRVFRRQFDPRVMLKQKGHQDPIDRERKPVD
jgi:hypothetical protein